MLSRDRLQKRFIEMVQMDSPSGGEKDMADWLETWLAQRGVPFRSDRAGDSFGGNGRNVAAYLKGTQAGMAIGFCAHMDQIGPCRNVQPVVDGSIIRTDGTTTLGGDDKAGIAAILEAVEDVLETHAPHRDIGLLFTCSEETGMLGTKHMDMSILPCLDLVVADAAGDTGVIAYQSPAMETISAVFHGKKAHAGVEPEKGVSAIAAAGRAIANMRIGRIDPETTANIGRMEGGGATNIVADTASFTAEIRSHSMARLAEELAYMEACCTEAAQAIGASCDFHHELAYPALSLDPDCALVQTVKAAMEAEGIAPDVQKTGGGSDANILAGRGCRSVLLGLGMRNVHTTEESLDMEEVWKAAKVLRRMMSV